MDEDTLKDIMEFKHKQSYVQAHCKFKPYLCKQGRYEGLQIYKLWLPDEKKQKTFRGIDDVDLIHQIYDFMMSGGAYTLDGVFKKYLEYKKSIGYAENTISDDTHLIKKLPSDFLQKRIDAITERDYDDALRLASHTVSRDRLKRLHGLLTKIWQYARSRKGLNLQIMNVPALCPPSEYFRNCPVSAKRPDYYTDEEVIKLWNTFRQPYLKTNPRSYLLRLSILTGLRAAEFPPLRWENITEVKDDKGKKYKILTFDGQYVKENGKYVYKPILKNEQKSGVQEGGFFVITEEIETLLDEVSEIFGHTGLIFHELDKPDEMLRKDGIYTFLRRHCTRLGIACTRNHGFRKSLNLKYEHAGLQPEERGMLMRNDPQTNIRFYLPSDDRKIPAIAEKVCNIKVIPTDTYSTKVS